MDQNVSALHLNAATWLPFELHMPTLSCSSRCLVVSLSLSLSVSLCLSFSLWLHLFLALYLRLVLVHSVSLFFVVGSNPFSYH